MGNCANDCSSICGKDGETGEFNMSVIKLNNHSFLESNWPDKELKRKITRK